MMKGGIILVAVIAVALCFSSPALGSDVNQNVVGNLDDEIVWQKMGLVQGLGAPGEPDDGSADSGSVMIDNGTYKVWYSGYDGNNWRLLYSTSPDGLVWTKHGVVVDLGPPGSYDDDYAMAPSVLKDNITGTYQMWYVGQSAASYGWRILYATSNDGINWQKHGLVISKTPEKSVAHPNVLIDDTGLYRMWYSEYDKSHWRICHATSSDGVFWNDQGVVLDIGAPGDIDSLYVYFPAVHVLPDGSYIMFYSPSDGNPYNELDTHYATSPDGMGASWTKKGLSLPHGDQPGDFDGVQAIPTKVTERPNGLLELWYTGYDGSRRRMMLAREIAQIPPVADIGIDQRIDEGQFVTLDASSSYDPDGDIVRYEFDFGDGTSHVFEPDQTEGGDSPVNSGLSLFKDPTVEGVAEELPIVEHQYGDDGHGSDGVFTVTLTVTDNDGLTDSSSIVVTVDNVDPVIVSLSYTKFSSIPRTVGFWGHQCRVEVPYGDHTGILQNWIDSISSQSRVFSGISTKVEVCGIVQDGNAEDMIVMAKRQLMALWLNIASGKLHPLTELYMPSLTSSMTLEEAIQEIEDVILTSIDRVELERVKNIADRVNNGIEIAEMVVESTATVTDPGSDDLTLTWDFGDGSPAPSTTYFNNDPLNTPDGYPSPEVNPMQITDTIHHSYAIDDAYDITLVAEDDDGGVSTSVVTVEVPDDWTTCHSGPVGEERRGASSYGGDWTPVPYLKRVLVSSMDGIEERKLTYRNTDGEEPVYADLPVATSPDPDLLTYAHLKRTSRVSDLAPPKPAPIGFGTTSTPLGRRL